MKSFRLAPRVFCFLSILFLTFFQTSLAQNSRLNEKTFEGLKLREIGPAQRSGRISDIVKDPVDKSIWYATVASGNVWKTVNNGTTWEPIFDDYPSYSIGCITIDPNNRHVLWLGTGENNGQRSVGYGDGVYKSSDGGASWENVGLKNSEHIGKIVVDPRNSDVVYVAAQGPLWAPGGDRGLYKTSDGGKSWERVLHISENTGISDVMLDPRDPDVIYAAGWQRRRHVGILVAGGPESRIYKSADGGKSWQKLMKGLPGENVDVGRIGLAISPQNPDVVYAQIAAEGEESGFWRSENRGASWEKRSDYICVDPQYYMEIFPDPHRFDVVYGMDVQIHVTEDGGKTFKPINSRFKHVDNHAMVFDPDDPDYLMVGCDGGIYETWDRSKTWRFIDNMPITQFYRVGIDDAEPFYNVYGGTQDNATLGGPSRTTTVHGIRNEDWFITIGGDGFQTRVEPGNPDILYSQYQYAGIVRYDKRSGERVDIQPQPGADDPPIKWNWDSPIIISPHSSTRLYFGSNILFRSDDRANTWTPVSGDLTRGFDRNQREVMGKVWHVDAVWKNVFTSTYGNMVALDESPLQEGLLYAGMDDGLIHVTENGGEFWRKIDGVPGVPERTYVADLLTSRHDAHTVYAVFNNHKEGDFKPYVFKSLDRGASWQSITGNLPDRHITWSIQEDHENPNLLFCATEFGLFFTIDGGEKWVQFKGGVPTVAFRDLEIQRRENDLVAASFGRGMFILDDYTPLREISEEMLQREAHLFPVKDAWTYIESGPMGWGEKASQGDGFYTAKNPPFGAIFTYYVRDGFESIKQKRKKAEREKYKKGETVSYPAWDDLRAEDREEPAQLIFEIRDSDDEVVRRISAPVKAGVQRISWDLRHSAVDPVRERNDGAGPSGVPAIPGTYSVQMFKLEDGRMTVLGEPQSFKTTPLGLATLPAEDVQALTAFQKKTARLQRAALAARAVVRETEDKLKLIKKVLQFTPGATTAMVEQARVMELKLLDLKIELLGDRSVRDRFEPFKPSILERINRSAEAHWRSTSAATTTHQRNYDIAAQAFQPWLEKLRELVEEELGQFEAKLEELGTPYTPGRGVPKWRPE